MWCERFIVSRWFVGAYNTYDHYNLNQYSVLKWIDVDKLLSVQVSAGDNHWYLQLCINQYQSAWCCEQQLFVSMCYSRVLAVIMTDLRACNIVARYEHLGRLIKNRDQSSPSACLCNTIMIYQNSRRYDFIRPYT